MIAPMAEWLTLTQALARTMNDHAPGWTGRNDRDPGITVLEILAFLAEGVQLHHGVVNGGAPVASRIVEALQAYERKESVEMSVKDERPVRVATLDDRRPDARAVLHEGWSGTKRPRFFPGRLLTADALSDEQHYHLEAHRRHLQMFHGSGIARGLQVEVDADGGTITIEPGVAVDARGREIDLAERATVAMPHGSVSPALIVLEYTERMVDPVPVSTDAGVEWSSIEQGCRVVIAASHESGVALARVVRDKDRWRVDRSFAPVRAGG